MESIRLRTYTAESALSWFKGRFGDHLDEAGLEKLRGAIGVAHGWLELEGCLEVCQEVPGPPPLTKAKKVKKRRTKVEIKRDTAKNKKKKQRTPFKDHIKNLPPLEAKAQWEKSQKRKKEQQNEKRLKERLVKRALIGGCMGADSCKSCE